MTTNVVKIEIKALKVNTNKVIKPVIKISSLLLVMFRKLLISNINFDNSTILFLFGIAILSTAIPTISYTITSQYLNPILTTSILLLQPFIAILFAFFFIQEIPDLLVIPGFIFILIGLFLIIKKPKK